MIKPEELRIGNFIKPATNMEGLKVGAPEVYFKINNDLFAHITHAPERFNYIPISEEWLNRFGFKIKEMNYGYVKDTEEGDIFIDKNYAFNFDGFSIGMSIELKYVHQLQNLYFALTGEELIIKD